MKQQKLKERCKESVLLVATSRSIQLHATAIYAYRVHCTEIRQPLLYGGDQAVRLKVYCLVPSLKVPMGPQKTLAEPRAGLVALAFYSQQDPQIDTYFESDGF